jgi:hypothetical protein
MAVTPENTPSWMMLVAKTCHEANRAIQISHGDPNPSPIWDDAPEWQKESALQGVAHAAWGATHEQLHDEWRKFKYADGWSYGPEKDAECKTHPCLVPYDELPEEQKLKDRVFLAIVKTFTESVIGFRGPDFRNPNG